MEKYVAILLPAILTGILFRLMLAPIKWFFKLLIYGACGLLCLWLLNSIARYTGIFFPINIVTILIAGFFGVPGIGIMAILQILAA